MCRVCSLRAAFKEAANYKQRFYIAKSVIRIHLFESPSSQGETESVNHLAVRWQPTFTDLLLDHGEVQLPPGGLARNEIQLPPDVYGNGACVAQACFDQQQSDGELFGDKELSCNEIRRSRGGATGGEGDSGSSASGSSGGSVATASVAHASAQQPGEESANSTAALRVHSIDVADVAARLVTIASTPYWAPTLARLRLGHGAAQPPPAVAAMIGLLFSSAMTNGNGGCAVHSAWGRGWKDGALFCEGARDLIIAVLGPTFADARRRVRSVELVDSVRTLVWEELAIGSSESAEARLFREALLRCAPDLAAEAAQGRRKKHAVRSMLHTRNAALMSALRNIFRPENEAALIRPLLYELGDIPDLADFLNMGSAELAAYAESAPTHSDYLREPFRVEAGRKVVRGAQHGTAFPDAGGPNSIYAALFDTRGCFDGLRRSFLDRVGEVEIIQFGSALEQTIAACAPGSVCAYAGRELLEARERFYATDCETVSMPADFVVRAWPAYLAALGQNSYYLSVDELVLVAKASEQNIVVAKRTGHGDFLIEAYTSEGPGPYAVVFLITNDAGRVRSHFERLLPLTEVQRLTEAVETARREAEAARAADAAARAAAAAKKLALAQAAAKEAKPNPPYKTHIRLS